MNLPLNSGEKYALIAVEAVTDLKGEIDLGEGLFAIRGGGLRLPDDWKGWLGSLESDAIERSNLVLLAKMPSGRPTVLDAENQLLQNRTNWLFWSLLASTRVWTKGGGTQLTGGRESGEISVNQQGRMSPIVLLPGLPRVRISEAHLRRAASLSLNLCDLISRPRMRRAKWAIQTFWSAFEEGNLGERIHQFVRVVSDGFAKAFGGRDFRNRCSAFVGEHAQVARRQLYMMRNNAEHFNHPDVGLRRLSVRLSLERAYLRAHQAEALARHCVARFVESRALWRHFRDEERIDWFWNLSTRECARLWGEPLDIEKAVAGFKPQYLPDEGP